MSGSVGARAIALLCAVPVAAGCAGKRESKPAASEAQPAAARDAAAPTEKRVMKIVAHRGASRAALENTLPAVNTAFAMGADAVEIDVRVSSDGVPMVFHDDDTERLGGVAKKVAAQTAAELSALDLGGGARMPTLADVAAAVPAGKTLFVELKDPAGGGSVAVVLAALPDDDRFAFQSFHAQVLHEIKRLRPGARTYATVGLEKNDRGELLPLDPAIVGQIANVFTGAAIDARGLSPAFAAAVAAQRERGDFELGVWTVNHNIAIRALGARGDIDWLETDVPDVAAAALGRAAP